MLDEPVWRRMLPEDPQLLEPDWKSKDPLTPFVPLFDVSMYTLPLEDDELAPDVKEMLPPDD